MAEELPLDRPFLESVTTAELLKIADSLGIDLPPGLDRTIVIEELLETWDSEKSPLGEPGKAGSKQNPGAAGPLGDPPDRGILAEKPPPATAPLPKHYNISYIEVLIRDPLWAFAFWEINAHDKETLEGAPDFGGYCLRVLPDLRSDIPGAGNRIVLKDSHSFTVQVGTGDSAWYLGFPPAGGRFQVELCAIRKDEPVVLTVSKPFRVPTLPEAAEAGVSVEAKASTANPLLRLSGIDDFNILRNTMRSSRLPKRCGLTAAGVQG
jgi:hypothetical protein